MAGFMKLETWHGTEEIEGESQTGYFARYSAPGYMDATESVGPCGSYKEAILECLAMYGEPGEGSIASADEMEAIDLLMRAAGMSETEASRLVLRP